MSDAFAPQVRALLDGLAPPALSAGFADRVLAQAEAALALPPLPKLRKPGTSRRIALTVGIAGLVSVAAAAAVVPPEVWRRVPVIGGIVELIASARPDPVAAPAPRETPLAVAGLPEARELQVASPAEPMLRPVAESEVVAPSAQPPAAVPPPRVEVDPPVDPSPAVARLREAPPQPERVMPAAERPTPAETRVAGPTAADRPAAPAPERITPAEVRDVRQQTRERAATTRQASRERIERRERQANRTN